MTTPLDQRLVPPWGEPALIDPAARAARTTTADERSTEVMIAELVASNGHLQREDAARG